MGQSLRIPAIRAVLHCLFFLSFSCQPCTAEYQYLPPEHIADGLPVGTLEEAGLQASKIGQASEAISCGKFKEVHSMLIYRHGKLVFEEYYPGYVYQWDAPEYRGVPIQWDRKRMHPTMSCTKSIVSACMDIAVENGFIRSVDQPIFDYLPDHQQFRTGGKEQITIEHLLTMTSGLQWNEWNAPHGTSANDIDRIYFECGDDPVKCVLERDLLHPPGAHFNYNGGCTLILGEIIRNASGMDIDAFSMKFLFGPLGIDSASWYRHPNGVIATDGSLYLTPRDMLKFGVLYLDGGSRQGERILSEDWVRLSSTSYGSSKGIKVPIEDSGRNGYGYSWWTSTFRHRGKQIGMYRANGWGGQTIMVFPDVDMVLVFTSGNYAARSSLFRIIRKYILPAVSD